MTNNAILHPWRALKLAVRRWQMSADLRNPDVPGDLPPAFERFAVGETLPWKGTSFKVGKIIGGDFPMIILVPTGMTRGAKIQGLRNMRDLGRAHLKRGAEVRKALADATR